MRSQKFPLSIFLIVLIGLVLKLSPSCSLFLTHALSSAHAHTRSRFYVEMRSRCAFDTGPVFCCCSCFWKLPKEERRKSYPTPTPFIFTSLCHFVHQIPRLWRCLFSRPKPTKKGSRGEETVFIGFVERKGNQEKDFGSRWRAPMERVRWNNQERCLRRKK